MQDQITENKAAKLSEKSNKYVILVDLCKNLSGIKVLNIIFTTCFSLLLDYIQNICVSQLSLALVIFKGLIYTILN